MTRKQNFFGQLILTADLVVLMESYLATYWLRSRMPALSPSLIPMNSLDTYSWVLPVLVPSWLIALRYFQLYDALTYKSPVRILSALLKTQVFAALILFSAIFILRAGATSRSLIGLFIVVSFLGFAAEKLTVSCLDEASMAPAAFHYCVEGIAGRHPRGRREVSRPGPATSGLEHGNSRCRAPASKRQHF